MELNQTSLMPHPDPFGRAIDYLRISITDRCNERCLYCMPEGNKVGLIGALTTTHFCAICNKLRLTADGKLRPCLGCHGEMDLLNALRDGRSAPQALEQAIANKPEKHEFLDAYAPGRPMTAIGG